MNVDVEGVPGHVRRSVELKSMPSGTHGRFSRRPFFPPFDGPWLPSCNSSIFNLLLTLWLRDLWMREKIDTIERSTFF